VATTVRGNKLHTGRDRKIIKDLLRASGDPGPFSTPPPEASPGDDVANRERKATIFFQDHEVNWKEHYWFKNTPKEKLAAEWDHFLISRRKELWQGTVIVEAIPPWATEKVVYSPPLGRIER
jgi:hypothetical protein